jgi:hypothetical protein
MAAELRQLIQQAHVVVRQRHFVGHWDVPTTNQAHVRDGVMGGPEGPRPLMTSRFSAVVLTISPP